MGRYGQRRVGDYARRVPASPERSIEALKREYPDSDLVKDAEVEVERKRDTAEAEKDVRKLGTEIVNVVKATPKLRKRRDKRRRIKSVGKSTTIRYRGLKSNLRHRKHKRKKQGEGRE